jgi:hypothetical protein
MKHYHVKSIEGSITCKNMAIAQEHARAIRKRLIDEGEVSLVAIEPCCDSDCTIDYTELGWV